MAPVIRIALRTLLHHRGRLIAALVGVAFATALLVLQLGVYRGLGAQSSALVRRFGGDVWLIARGTRHVDQADPLDRADAAALAAHPCVASVRPLIVGYAPYRTAAGGVDGLQLIGSEPVNGRVFPWSMEAGLPSDLAIPMRVSVDRSDAEVLIGATPPLGASFDLAGRRVFVAAVTRGIRSLGLNPMVFTNLQTARALLGWGEGEASFFIADVRDRACVAAITSAFEGHPRLEALAPERFAARTEAELFERSGIGVAVGFVSALGLVVALVVVAQTLLATLSEHRRELSMLGALGATRGEVAAFAAWQAAAIAVLGTSLGLLGVLAMRGALDALAIQLVLSASALSTSLGAVGLTCLLASAAAVRAAWRVSPMEVLR